MSPVRPVSIKLSNQETIEKLNKLNPEDSGKSNPEFFIELLECYEQFKGLTCSNQPDDYFKTMLIPNLKEADKEQARKAKENVIRELFELSNNDSLKVTECELLEKASEVSGKSIEEMAIEGRLLVAKNEIGRHIQYMQGKGKKGVADERIAQTLEVLKASGQKLSLNRLTQASGSNRKTVETWCERNNITFE